MWRLQQVPRGSRAQSSVRRTMAPGRGDTLDIQRVDTVDNVDNVDMRVGEEIKENCPLSE